ncbi:MAG: heavy-metal-associated domain-containing protein [Bacteroidales bacterium]|nr:heavy-metal-associated domain-containing protein [Bacteroidales bacterium]
MKKILLLALMAIFTVGAYAQMQTVTIQTNGVCQKCADCFKANVPYFKGVKDYTYDMKTAKLTINYDSKKTNPDALRTQISKLGYNADNVKADPAAREKLPACCKGQSSCGQATKSCQGKAEGEHKCQGQANGQHKCQGQANGEHKCQGQANGEHKCQGQANGEHKCQGQANGQHKCQGQANGEHKCQGQANGEHKCQGQANGEHKCQGQANGEHKCQGHADAQHQCQGQKANTQKSEVKR